MPTAATLRNAIADLATIAASDLDAVWRQLNEAEQAREALLDTLPLLIRTYGAAAGTVAADWYDDTRDEAAARGRFRASPVVIDTSADALARWGVTPLFSDTPDFRRARVMVEGGLQRRIANASRDTVRSSAIADPGADGWQRTGVGECAFCRMLINRGAVYTEQTVDFAAHDHCNCQAVPKFTGDARPVQPYSKSERTVTDADRARVRAYLASNEAG